MTVARRLLLVLTILLAALVPAREAAAAGGDYVFVGGSEEAQAQVRAALERSAFDWDLVPARITIRIARCGCAGSKPGEIVLDEDVLTRSPFGPRYAWGIVQDEYAHQVDFFLLEDEDRLRLRRRYGGRAWCYEVTGLRHDQYGCERFSTLVAWAYWPSSQNVRRPDWRPRGAPALRRDRFRALLSTLLA